jgi:hypothetical protein
MYLFEAFDAAEMKSNKKNTPTIIALPVHSYAASR